MSTTENSIPDLDQSPENILWNAHYSYAPILMESKKEVAGIVISPNEQGSISIDNIKTALKAMNIDFKENCDKVKKWQERKGTRQEDISTIRVSNTSKPAFMKFIQDAEGGLKTLPHGLMLPNDVLKEAPYKPRVKTDGSSEAIVICPRDKVDYLLIQEALQAKGISFEQYSENPGKKEDKDYTEIHIKNGPSKNTLINHVLGYDPRDRATAQKVLESLPKNVAKALQAAAPIDVPPSPNAKSAIETIQHAIDGGTVSIQSLVGDETGLVLLTGEETALRGLKSELSQIPINITMHFAMGGLTIRHKEIKIKNFTPRQTTGHAPSSDGGTPGEKPQHHTNFTDAVGKPSHGGGFGTRGERNSEEEPNLNDVMRLR
jgi:hypothetical protein